MTMRTAILLRAIVSAPRLRYRSVDELSARVVPPCPADLRIDRPRRLPRLGGRDRRRQPSPVFARTGADRRAAARDSFGVEIDPLSPADTQAVGIGRETRKLMLDHDQQTKNMQANEPRSSSHTP